MNALANDQAQRLADLITARPVARGRHRRALHRPGGPAAHQGHPGRADHRPRRHAQQRPGHPAHQLQDARPAAAARRRTPRSGQHSAPVAAVPRARRVPHLRRRPGHRRRHAAASARAGAQGHWRTTRRRRRPTGRSGASPRSPRRRRWATRATRRRCSASPSTVFGEPFDDDAVVTESRLERRRVGRPRPSTACDRELAPRRPEPTWSAERARPPSARSARTPDLADAVLAAPFDDAPLRRLDAAGVSDGDLLRAHPLTRALLEGCRGGAPLVRGWPTTVFGSAVVGRSDAGERSCRRTLGALSHVRFVDGRDDAVGRGPPVGARADPDRP